MSGNMTHGYDLVMEMSEDTLNAFLARMQTTNRIIEIEPLGTVEFMLNLPTAEFAAESMLNGIRLRIPIDIILQDINISARADVSLTVPIISYPNPEGMIYPALDFRECTVEIESLEFSGGGDREHNLLREQAGRRVQTMLQEQVRVYEIPIDIRSDRFTIHALEVRIIDNNCLVIMIAFDEEGIGDAGDFTECHLPASGAAIFISNQWLMRSLIAPALMDRFSISEDMADVFTFTTTGMSLQNPINLDHLNDRSIVDHVTLDTMTVTFSVGQIDIAALVNITGRGFSGSGSISGRVLINAVDGNISIRIEIDEPEIEIRAEWWMHLLHVIGLILCPIVGSIIATVVRSVIRGIEDSLGQIEEEGVLELPIEIGSIEIDDLLLSGEYVLPPMPELEYSVTIRGDMRVTDINPISTFNFSRGGFSGIILRQGLTHEGDFEASTYNLCYPLDNIQWSLAGIPLDAEGSVTIDETPVEFVVDGLNCNLKTQSGGSLNTELSIGVVDHRGISAFYAINLRVEGQRSSSSFTHVDASDLIFLTEHLINTIDWEGYGIYDDPRVFESYSQSYVSLVDTVVQALNVGMEQQISCNEFHPH